MHLALVINSLGIGGAERVLVRLAHHLADCGHQVSFITFFQEQNFCYQLNTDHNNINLINLGEQKPKYNNYYLKIKKLFLITKRIFLLKKLFNKLQPDLILSFLVGVNITVLLANIYSKIPVVVSERIDPNKHIIPWFYKKLRLITYKFAELIIVQTQTIKNYFPDYLQEKIVIIPNWVKKPVTINKNIQNIKNIKNIISLGRLDQQKDHKTLIIAFAELAVDYPDLNLTIYGDGILRNLLQNLINSLKLQDRIFLPGITMDVESALVSADLFVFPSLYEGFSNALCEAMAMGLPVIASNCSGNTDIVEHGINGLLFNSLNTEELVVLIKQLLHNPAYANTLAANAKNITNKFNELEILQLWNNSLETVLRKNYTCDKIKRFWRDGREA